MHKKKQENKSKKKREKNKNVDVYKFSVECFPTTTKLVHIGTPVEVHVHCWDCKYLTHK